MEYCYFCVTGNSNLIYQIIRKRSVFHQLANLSVDQTTISKVLNKRGKKPPLITTTSTSSSSDSITPETPVTTTTSTSPADQQSLKATLAATPGWLLLLLPTQLTLCTSQSRCMRDITGIDNQCASVFGVVGMIRRYMYVYCVSQKKRPGRFF